MSQLNSPTEVLIPDSSAPIVSHAGAPPCPVPDWEYGPLRAYTKEEIQAIGDWSMKKNGGLSVKEQNNLSSRKPMKKRPYYLIIIAREPR